MGSSDRPGALRRSREIAALRLARRAHLGHADRYGEPSIAHVERVAGAVPPSARAVALVCDLCGRGYASASEVSRILDLDDDERDALVLLVPVVGESLAEHVRRIDGAPRSVGRELALLIKRAEVEDHVQRTDPAPTQYVRALETMATALNPRRPDA